MYVFWICSTYNGRDNCVTGQYTDVGYCVQFVGLLFLHSIRDKICRSRNTVSVNKHSARIESPRDFRCVKIFPVSCHRIDTSDTIERKRQFHPGPIYSLRKLAANKNCWEWSHLLYNLQVDGTMAWRQWHQSFVVGPSVSNVWPELELWPQVITHVTLSRCH